MNNADMYLAANSKYFDSSALPYLREKLLNGDETTVTRLQMVELKDPTTMLIILLIAGFLGIDRIMLGDVGLGILKLITAGGCGIWAIVDWFLISGITKKKNFEKVSMII